MTTSPASTAAELTRRQRQALIAGIAAGVLAILGAILNLRLFLHAYLTAYWFWLDIALGCLGILMIQNLAGGTWGAVIRRFLEAGVRTLPLMAVLFLPVLAGMGVIYGWTQPGGIGQPALPAFKQLYLSIPFFIPRAVIYFAVWILLGRSLVRWSRERDERPLPELTARLRGLSAIGLVLLALTVTFAAVDWLMSLEATWFSSIFGAMVGMGALLTGFAFAILLLLAWAKRPPFAAVVSPELFNRLGSLLLAFLMLWAYLAFSQLILIYAGNLTDEITWYIHRSLGGWLAVAVIIVLFQFALPFAFLIMRPAKRSRRLLSLVCADLVLAHYVNMYWIVQPAFPRDSLLVVIFNVVLAVALGGLWLAFFARGLAGAPLLAKYDPQLIAGLEVAND